MLARSGRSQPNRGQSRQDLYRKPGCLADPEENAFNDVGLCVPLICPSACKIEVVRVLAVCPAISRPGETAKPVQGARDVLVQISGVWAAPWLYPEKYDAWCRTPDPS